jgi:hypothetical protein
MGNRVSLEEELINFRIVSKQMQRSSKKCEKNEKAAIEKLKKVSRDIPCFELDSWPEMTFSGVFSRVVQSPFLFRKGGGGAVLSVISFLGCLTPLCS